MRELLGQPDEVAAIGPLRSMEDWGTNRPLRIVTGCSYNYVLKDTGKPGDGNNEFIHCVFTKTKKLKNIILQGPERTKALEPLILGE